MKNNKLKVFWFLLIPLAWFLVFQLIKWIQYYPIDCTGESAPAPMCIFFGFTGIIGSILIFAGAIGLAVYLQD